MTAMAARGSRSGKKEAVNKRLLYVLGAVLVLVVALKLMPGVLGGGTSSVKPFRPTTSFHFRSTPAPAPGSVGAGAVTRPSRDPFAPPPGYATR
jgi:hypothetical protein